MENTLGLKPKFEVFTIPQDELEKAFRDIIKKNTGVDVGEALYIDMYEDNTSDIMVRLDDCAEHLTDEDIDKISEVYDWDGGYQFSYELLNEIFGADRKPYLKSMYKDQDTKVDMVAIQAEI